MRKGAVGASKRGSVGASEGWSFVNLITRLKIDFEADYRRPFARQFGVERERVEAIIAVGDVQHAGADFQEAARKAIANKRIELPEIVTRLGARIPSVALSAP